MISHRYLHWITLKWHWELNGQGSRCNMRPTVCEVCITTITINDVTLSHTEQQLYLGCGPSKHVQAPTSIKPTSHNWSLKSSFYKGITAATIQFCGLRLDYILHLQKIISVRAFYTKRAFAVSRYNSNHLVNFNKAIREDKRGTAEYIFHDKRQTDISENNGYILYYSKTERPPFYMSYTVVNEWY